MRNQEIQRRISEKLRRELGPLIESALSDDEVVEILINPDQSIWIERLGRTPARIGETDATRTHSLIATLASTLGTVVDAQHTNLSGILSLDGSRIDATIPPQSPDGPTINIRKRALRVFRLSDYVARGSLTPAQKTYLDTAIIDHKNLLVVGGTGTGKTTFVNALIGAIADLTPDDRPIILEDTREIKCESPNHLVMTTTDHKDFKALLADAMRKRPDRIILGEVRDGAALAILNAWNSGHPGGIMTFHADSTEKGLYKLEEYIEEASMTPKHALIAAVVDIVVFLKRAPARHMQVEEISEVLGYDPQNGFITQPIS